MPDVRLAQETLRGGAFAYLHLGRDADAAKEALATLASRVRDDFGVAVVDTAAPHDLPPQVTRILLPWGFDDSVFPAEPERVWQVRTFHEAEEAIAASASAIAVKGNDSEGDVCEESTFMLFQRVIGMAVDRGVRVYVHGGVGVHSGAAYLALGASGLHLDSQVVLLPECGAPRELKAVLRKLTSGETTIVQGWRVLRWPTMPRLGATENVIDYLGGWNLDANLIPLGQDFHVAGEYFTRYGHLDTLVTAIHEAAYGHLRQAQHRCALSASTPFARKLSLTYPVIQGPMARVSDTAQFMLDVADAGAMPMLAIGMSSPEATAAMLAETGRVVSPSPWGAGLLGFIQPAVFDAQAEKVIASDPKPTAVVVAGGRPSQAKKFEQAGIRAFLHVPAASLLDQYIKEGVRSVIFEGRESGGHVGSLYSTILWEKQIMHLLDLDDPSIVTAVFAGGIHDSFSAAFVAIMAASLAARGVDVGVQMGSAYLMTTEAVTSGAITRTFQDLLAESDHTVLLESAPGQETRALPTAFVDFFQKEKARVEALDVEALDKRLMLEDLNLGRARLATKGRMRRGETRELVDVDPTGQLSDGLYMAGSVTPLLRQPQTMAQLHEAVSVQAEELVRALPPVVDLDNPSPDGDETESFADLSREPIAIIGMAGVFPDAHDIDEYWSNTLTGRDCVTEVPRYRWDPAIFYRPDTTDTDHVTSKWGAFLSGVAFDPMEFGIPPASLNSIEPVQLVGLLVAKRALSDAGYADSIKEGLPDTSVIFAAEAMGELSAIYGLRTGLRSLFGLVPEDIAEELSVVDEDSFPGVLSNVIAGRIANRLNCGGRNYVVDAACASSLAAVDVACQELWSGRSSMVICGGADMHNSILDYVWFSGTHALSPRGFCATFDESGDGLALGEGVAAIIMKRLSDAERDQDKIYGVIRGVEGSSDGRSLGLTAPNMSGQVKALKRAYQMAGILPSEVGLVEAHGTGTAVGDRTELTALSRVMLDAGALPGQTWIGSVKTQIGHTKCTAGVAGLIRATLAVRHGVIPPTLHLEKPVHSYHAGVTPFSFNANGHAGVWTDQRRIAGVSGFGFGGSNFHAIVENYVPTPPEQTAAVWPCELFLVRGDSLDDARQRLRGVTELWAVNHEIHLRDVAYSLATESDKPVQVCIVSESWAALLEAIEHVQQGDKVPGVFYRDPVPGKVSFLFPGQGSQKVNMARDLFVMFPFLREPLALHPDYAQILFPQTVFTQEARNEQAQAITDTRNAQPILGIVDSAVAQLLTWCGIEPDAVAGHSYGELPALAYAGAISSTDLVGLSRARAEAILSRVGEDPGAMAALTLPQRDVEELLTGHKDLWPVNFNATNQTVVGGTTPAIDALVVECKNRRIRATRLDVACAFHSPLLEGADRAFAGSLEHVDLQEPRLAVWSNTTAKPYPTDEAAIKERLCEHLVRPVRFTDELHAMYDDGVRVFIEAGPGTALIGLAGATLPSDIVTVPTQDTGEHGMRTFLRGLAQLVASGRTIDAGRLFSGRHVTALNLDTPAQYATASTTWLVDGKEAIPIAQWRDQGEQHLIIETRSYYPDTSRTDQGEDNMSETPAPSAHPTTELVPPPVAVAQPLMPTPQNQLVYTYLQNLRVMLDDQRDIVLASMAYGQGQYSMPMMGGAAQMAPMMPMAPMAYMTPMPTMAPTAYMAPPQPMPTMPPMAPVAPMPAEAYQPMAAMPTATPVAQPTPMPPAAPTVAAVAPEVVAEDVTSAVAQLAPDLQAPVEQPDDSVGPSSASVLPQLTDLTKDQLTQIILDLVAEKTGYPPEMMGLDMDLEADLSIDSIKRLEIIGALEEKVALPTDSEVDADAADAVLETLATIKTLRMMVDFLQSIDDPNAAASAPVETASESDQPSSQVEAAPSRVEQASVAEETPAEDVSASPANAAEGEVPITRLVWRSHEIPFSDESRSLDGHSVAVTSGRFAQGICERLTAEGATAKVLKPGDSLTESDTVVFVADDEVWGMKELFTLLKGADLSVIDYVGVFDDSAGRILAEPDTTDFSALQGFRGFIKSMAHEYPGIQWKVCTVLTPFDETAPDVILREVMDPAMRPDVTYDHGKRFRYKQMIEEHSDATPWAGLDESSVVIWLGGAQGISTHLMQRMASQMPCHYVLVGRTERNPAMAQKYEGLHTRDEVQKYLIQSEHMNDLKQIIAKVGLVMKAISIENALASIAATGATCSYECVDVCDPTALHALVDRLITEKGHVDGLVHAAGVLDDKLFRDKSWESFEKVYSTKVAPLPVIAQIGKAGKLMVFFTSVSGSLGNRGQTDYAAGNDALDMAAEILSMQSDSLRVVSFAFGGWKGAGMVSPTLEAEMGRRGFTLLPLDSGGEVFMNELMEGHEPQVMMLGGNDVQINSIVDKTLSALG